jgi:predicted small lipoprotein YifL
VIRAALAMLLLAAALAGCGKKGAPVPPGPPQDIIYPKAYPNPLLP